MPTAEQIRQWLVGAVLPIVSAAAATWAIVHLHFLTLFHVTAGSLAGVISQLGVLGITALLSFLTGHHILSGKYTPAARAAVAARKSSL